MKNIYVVRHCKADGQASEARLTVTGVEQAEKLATFLADKEIDTIISSPFERAHRTIAPFAEKIGVEITLDERLTERVLTGQNHPDWVDMLRQTFDDMDLCFEGGESSRTAMQRAIPVVMEVLKSNSKNAVIVSHGNLIALLLKHFDDRIGFAEWEALTNPDVYHLSFSEEKPTIQRIWAE